MTKVTRLTVDDGGNIKSRRIHLREISGDSDTPLETVGQDARYGVRLMPQLYEMYNPMPYDGARDLEVELAIGLREAGYGVWQA